MTDALVPEGDGERTLGPVLTKAVIPAAGLGTRFLPATKATPKEMLPVVDKPAIQYVVEEAVAAGLSDVLVITGRNKRSLEDHFDRAWELEEALQAKGDSFRLARVQKSNVLADMHYTRQGDPQGARPRGALRGAPRRQMSRSRCCSATTSSTSATRCSAG